MTQHHLKRINHPRPSTGAYIARVFRNLFSLTCLRQVIHLAAYYLVNHVGPMRLAHIHPRARIRPTVLMRHPQRIFIGAHSTINHNNILWAGKQDAVIRIGANVMTGPNVQMFAFNHGTDLNAGPMIDQPYTEQDIIVEDDVWIGAAVTLLPGAHIHSGAVIAAAAVVNSEIPSHAIAAGAPAQVIRHRQNPKAPS